jgi:hypothetical protein
MKQFAVFKDWQMIQSWHGIIQSLPTELQILSVNLKTA